jgi:hypothetical protein
MSPNVELAVEPLLSVDGWGMSAVGLSLLFTVVSGG